MSSWFRERSLSPHIYAHTHTVHISTHNTRKMMMMVVVVLVVVMIPNLLACPFK